MDNISIEQKAADTLLERGVRVKVQTPLFLRVFGKKTMTLPVPMPKLGTSLRISRIYLSMGIEDKKLDDLDMNDLLKLQAMHGSKIALLVAHVILNGYWSGKILARPLAAWLKWRMPIRSLYTIMQMVVLHGGTADFLNTIRLTRHLKMTEPNLSQETERS